MTGVPIRVEGARTRTCRRLVVIDSSRLGPSWTGHGSARANGSAQDLPDVAPKAEGESRGTRDREGVGGGILDALEGGVTRHAIGAHAAGLTAAVGAALLAVALRCARGSLLTDASGGAELTRGTGIRGGTLLARIVERAVCVGTVDLPVAVVVEPVAAACLFGVDVCATGAVKADARSDRAADLKHTPDAGIRAGRKDALVRSENPGRLQTPDHVLRGTCLVRC